VRRLNENKPTKTYYSEDYEPMKKREFIKAGKEATKDIKEFSQNERGWGKFKRIREYNKQRLQEYHDIAWDYEIDIYTMMYIMRSNTDGTGIVHLEINITYDDETGKITEYDIGDTEKGWEHIKEEAYNSYLKTHDGCIESRENILRNIRKEIEKRTPLILNLLKEKPRSRSVPAKVRYEVFRRDDGKCVLCGSNIDIEFDHIIPFSLGGSNNADNIRVLCQDCNRSKGNRIEKF